MDIRKGSRLSVKPLEDLHVVPVELFLKTGRVLASPVSFLHAGLETFVKLRRIVRRCRHQASLVTTDSSRRGYPSIRPEAFNRRVAIYRGLSNR